jgi:hypothetical protein
MGTNIYKTAGLTDYWVGADLRGTATGPTDPDLLPDYPALGRHLQARFSGNDLGSTIALLDWSTIRHVRDVMTGQTKNLDLFVALADLNTILAAVLFYDRAVVIDDEQSAAEVADLLGISDVLVPLDSDEGPRTEWGASVLLEAFESSFQQSAAELGNLQPDSALTKLLNAAWKDLIPEAQLPHQRDVNDVGWSLSPGLPQLFGQLRSSGEMGSRDDTDLVVENDVRAMTYENVASLLTGALAPATLTGPNVRYLGGVLRAPMQRALRARWREAWDRKGGLPLEESLNKQWAQSLEKQHAPPAFPFWLSAILQSCETRRDLAKVVPKWRERTKQLRKRRAAIEKILLDGDLTATASYEKAIAGTVADLAEAQLVDVAFNAAKVGVETGLALTGMAPFMADAASALLNSEVANLLKPKTTWLMRVTRPRLWFLAHANASAMQLTEPTYRLRELFKLPAPPEGTRDLLARANRLDWCV